MAIELAVALDIIGTAFELDVDALIDAAYQDPHGGYHAAYEDDFPIGSVWRVEGQLLYALVRVLKPQRVLELGTFHGCSATHIAQALADNGGGSLVCVDMDVDARVGDLIPPELTQHIEFIRADFADYLLLEDGHFDLIFEDGLHETAQVEMIWRAAYDLLTPGGMIVSHDAEHFVVGQAVREGIHRAGFFSATPPAQSTLIAPSDCGVAVWRKLTAQTLDYTPPDEPKQWTSQDVDLNSLTVAVLLQYAEQRGIDVPSRATKPELIQLIQDDL